MPPPSIPFTHIKTADKLQHNNKHPPTHNDVSMLMSEEYLRSLKQYREDRPALFTVTKRYNNYSSPKRTLPMSKVVDRKVTSRNIQEQISEGVAKYEIKSYELDDRLFVVPVGNKRTSAQSDQPPLVRYSNVPSALKYERISVPLGVLDKPLLEETDPSDTSCVDSSLAASRHCRKGWLGVSDRLITKTRGPKGNQPKQFGEFDIRSTFDAVNYEDRINSIVRGNELPKSPVKSSSYTSVDYADGVITQSSTWGVRQSNFYKHFSSATKKLLQKEQKVRRPVLHRVKLF
jgi:hypothetical protein